MAYRKTVAKAGKTTLELYAAPEQAISDLPQYFKRRLTLPET